MKFAATIRPIGRQLLLAKTVFYVVFGSGCSSHDKQAEWCPVAMVEHRDAAEESALGTSGEQLRQRAIGTYELQARNDEFNSFTVSLSVSSTSALVEETLSREPSVDCPSSLSLRAHFVLDGAAANLSGEWDGLVILEKPAESSANGRIIARASPNRSDFSQLPEFAATSDIFGFQTTLDEFEPSGGIGGEMAASANGGPTTDSLTLARWGSQ